MRLPTTASTSFRFVLALVAALGSSCASRVPEAAGAPGASETPGSFFTREVRPILDASCVRCHGVRSRKAELDLRTAAGIDAGSESGAVVRAGDPDQSPLYLMVRDGKMPPGRNKRLSEHHVEAIRRWIIEGASF